MRQLTLIPPGDKSISHRALFLGALAAGTSRFRGLLTGDDARSAARVLRQLGAKVSPLREGTTVRVRGRGTRWSAPDGSLDCGNSGTTARLLLGTLAAQPFAARVTGDRSLRQRPMRRVTEPLERMGAAFEGDATRLPLAIRGGPLESIDYESPMASAQVKSALLLAGLAGGIPVTVRQPGMSRDHTERMLRALGVEVRTRDDTVSLQPKEIQSFDMCVPRDASSAAFLVAAGLLAWQLELRLKGIGLNPTRTGALGVLRRMGADIRIERARDELGEPVGDVIVRPSPLHATTVTASEIPSLIDEVPVLAALASRAEGTTTFEAVGELRVKESDRLSLIASNLRALGVTAAVDGEDLSVTGGDAPPAGSIETARDHRLVMAFSILEMITGARLRFSEVASAGVSYPGFFDHLRAIKDASGHRD